MSQRSVLKVNMVKKIFINVSILFLSLILFLCIAEVTARLMNKRKMHVMKSFKYITSPELDDKTDFRMKIPVYPKTNRTVRIICLGDSYTWGDYVSDPEDVWTSVLEKNLSNVYKDRIIEVVNFGKRGFTTLNEFELLQKIGLRLNPNIIVIQYNINDPLPSGKNFTRISSKWLKNETRDLIPKDSLHEALISKSRFYEFLNDRYKALQYKFSGRTMYDQLYEDDFKGWINCKKALFSIAMLAHKAKAEVVLMITPRLIKGIWDADTYPYISIHKKVIKLAKSLGMHAFDLLPDFIEEGRNFKIYQSLGGYDLHPNLIAHEIFADSLTEYIIENGLVQVSRN